MLAWLTMHLISGCYFLFQLCELFFLLLNLLLSILGDWNISILFEGQHIQGSPFNVRVYDAAQVKVFGLEGGSVGKQFSFSGNPCQIHTYT